MELRRQIIAGKKIGQKLKEYSINYEIEQVKEMINLRISI